MSLFRNSIGMHALLFIGSAFLLPHSVAQQYRPGLEYRSLNTGAYEIAIQKNGRLDVTLSSDEPVFLNAFPMVWFADKKKPEIVKLDGRYSERQEVNDALGRGQGMRIRYRDFQWNLRAYPTKPYFAIQLVYINGSKKAVQIKQLIPWAIGNPKKGAVSLGPETIGSRMFVDGIRQKSLPLTTGNGEAPNMIALLNPTTRRSLIAGFTTQKKAFNSVHVQSLEPKKDELEYLNYMRAANTYDPPVTVPPGGILESETLYLAIGEADPLIALERYAKAIAVTNRIPVYSEPPMRNIVVPASGDGKNQYKEHVTKIIDHVKSSVKSSEHIRIIMTKTLGHNATLNDLEVSNCADEVRNSGFQVGLYTEPFSYRRDDEIVKLHPEWFISIHSPISSAINPPDYLLDITLSEARNWLATNLRTRYELIGFDSLWGVDISLYNKVNNPEFHTGTSINVNEFRDDFSSKGALTRIEIIRLAMDTLRAAVGNKMSIVLNPSSLLPTFPNTHQFIGSGHTSSFFQSPHLGHKYSNANDIEPAEAGIRSINRVHVGETFGNEWIPDIEQGVFFPPLLRPAKPQDLFFNDDPAIWLRRGNSPTGHWMLAGINNDSDTSRTITLPINDPGGRNQPQFTLFDLESQSYYGNTQTRVNINVPKQTMRTLLLRQYKRHPLLVGTSLPIGESLPEKIDERWDPSTGVLTGSFVTSHSSGVLYFLQPQGYQIESVSIDGSTETWLRDGKVLSVDIRAVAGAQMTWSLTFMRK